jgi:SAM-dependent methyltransferase
MKFNPNRWFGRLPPRSDRDSTSLDRDLEDWCQSPAGVYMIASQQRAIDSLVARTAGYRGMLLKSMRSSFTIAKAPQLHKFALAPFPAADVSALTDLDALPLPSSLVDVAVLHHVLDFSEFPHEALKEAARVVQASGHLVVVGFNPWSFFGLCRLIRGFWHPTAIWSCRCLPVSRVTDWLRFVGFQPEKIVYGAYRPLFQTSKILNKIGFLDRVSARLHLPTGNYYIIVARKIRLRPIRGKPWLASAIKPVNIASRAQAKNTDHID